jgi:predicted PurR-regulated permease PerM
MNLKNNRETLLQIGAISAMVCLGLMIAYSLKGFLNAFLGAVIVYVLFRKVMINLNEKKKWKKNWAAIIIILSTFLIVLAPIVIFTLLFIPKLTIFFADASIILQSIENLDLNIKKNVGIEILSADNIKAAQAQATTIISGILNSTFEGLGQIAIMYFVLFFMLTNIHVIENAIRDAIPMKKEYIDRFAKELEDQTFSNAIGSPVLALIQGLFASLGYWVFGLSEPFFWGIMTGFFSFIPFVGSALIWLPAALYMFTTGLHWQAAGIVIYGVVVIGSVDNIFRFLFQKKVADVHPLVTVLGVIIGLNLFGLVGLIFGPLMLSYFLIMFQIYKQQYLLTKEE